MNYKNFKANYFIVTFNILSSIQMADKVIKYSRTYWKILFFSQILKQIRDRDSSEQFSVEIL